MAEKQRVYGERYPIDEDFLAALAHMPQASGIALGFDRLVMLATGAARIEQVVWTPVAETGMKTPAHPCRAHRRAARRPGTAAASSTRSRRAMPSPSRRRWRR